jgi:hypothetical protein
MSRDQYRQWRDHLIGQGFAMWKNGRDERQGWKLAMAPGEIVRQMLTDGSWPSPTAGDQKSQCVRA